MASKSKEPSERLDAEERDRGTDRQPIGDVTQELPGKYPVKEL